MTRQWVKSWVDILDNPKVMSLPGGTYKVWSCLLHIAGRIDRDGLLPSIEKCAFIIHSKVPELQAHIDALVEAELLDQTSDGLQMHDWSDWQTRKPSDEPERVRERVQKSRSNAKAEVTPRNAIQSDTESVTPNTINANDVTPSNAIHNVTENVTPVTPLEEIRLEETRAEEKRETPPYPPQAGEAQDEPAPTSERPKRSRSPTTTPIPNPFLLTVPMQEWADEKGFDDTFVDRATEEFVLWVRSESKQFTDWPAAWQKSLNRASEMKPSNVRQIRRA